VHHILNTVNSEDRQEYLYDFHNATESMMELFRHVIRGVCQNNEKAKIMNNLTPDSAFAVFDWGQKIIPHAYRESQKDYYGKKVLSILIGSFFIRNTQTSTIPESSNATTTSSITNVNYRTSTYIIALTHANQNDLDTLSATQLILAQFNSGCIPEYNSLTWQKYSFSFIPSSSLVTLLMISNAPSGIGNDIVIDDMALRVCSQAASGLCPPKQ
jgi:hypothetical protein